MEPPYPWRTVSRGSTYSWLCRDCGAYDVSVIEEFTHAAIDHARDTGHQVTATQAIAQTVEGMKI